MALDIYSSILGLLLQATGNNNNSWGDNANNSVFKVLERAVAGVATRTVTGGTLDLSASAPPSAMTQAIDAIQLFGGTLTSDQTVEVPNLSKVWLVGNATSGAFDLAFKTPSGTISEAIPQGGWAFVYCDGDNNINVGLSTALRDVQWLGADGTISAPGLSFAAEPTVGFRRVDTGKVALTIGGVDIATFSATGVDVGTGLVLSVGGAAVVPPGTEVDTASIRAPTGWYMEYGQAVSRSGDLPLMNAITEAFTANTNGTTTLSNVSSDLRNLGLEGSILEGVGIQTGTTIVSVDSASQITMSLAATNTATGGAVRAFPFGNGDGSTTFNVPDGRGVAYAGRDNMGGTAAGRITSAGSGVDGLRLKTIGGTQNITLSVNNLPPYTPQISVASAYEGQLTITGAPSSFATGSGDAAHPAMVSNGTSTYSLPAITNTVTATAQGGTSAPFSSVQPTAIRNKIIKR